MPRRSLRQLDLDAIADSQRGLVTAAQLRAIGYPDSTASRRVAGGMWTRLLPGVHLVSGGRPDAGQRTLATLLYAGEDALVTGTTALTIRRFRSSTLPSDELVDAVAPVHVLVPHTRRRLSTGFARIERTRRLPAPQRVDGFPVVPLVRAIGDSARRFRSGHDVATLISEALQRGLVTLDELRDELEAGPVQGSAHLRDALALLAGGALSPPEGQLGRLLESARIPHVVLNARLVTSGGRFIAVADAWLDDAGVAIEVDSRAHHSMGDDFDRTIRRNARYAAAGVPVVPVLPTDLSRRPAAVLRTIEVAREKALSTARPDVHLDVTRNDAARTPAWPWGA